MYLQNIHKNVSNTHKKGKNKIFHLVRILDQTNKISHAKH